MCTGGQGVVCHSKTERCGGAAEPDGGGHLVNAKGEGHTGGVLGRSGEHRGVCPQLGAHEAGFRRTLGCMDQIKKTKPNLTKLEDRGPLMVLLGYEDGKKAYRLCGSRGGKVLVSRDVVFDEKVAWNWEVLGKGEVSSIGETFIIEMAICGGDAGAKEPVGAEVASGALSSLAMAGAGEQTLQAAAHTPPPQSPGRKRTPLDACQSPSSDIEFVDAF